MKIIKIAPVRAISVIRSIFHPEKIRIKKDATSGLKNERKY
jgi:hypothetical protein